MSNKKLYYSHFSQWIINHCRAILFATGELTRFPIANLMTLIVMSIAIALPSGLFLFLENVQSFSKNWTETPTISLYVNPGATDQQVATLQTMLQHNPKIQTVKYISPQQGLSELSKVSGYSQIVANINENPLPGVFIVTPNHQNQSPQMLKILASSLKNLPQVNLSQLDMTWIKRLYFIMSLSKRIIITLALFFGIGVILIVSNTIRLSLESHLQEINILKLLGATSSFVRRPLLYKGVFYGFLSGLLAWLLISGVLYWLRNPAISLANTYHLTIPLQGLGLSSAIKIIVLSTTLAYLGSWLALMRPLEFTEEID